MRFTGGSTNSPTSLFELCIGISVRVRRNDLEKFHVGDGREREIALGRNCKQKIEIKGRFAAHFYRNFLSASKKEKRKE